jgi:outer membrane protein TolC
MRRCALKALEREIESQGVRTRARWRRVQFLTLLLPLTACAVGPNFYSPEAPVAGKWLESGNPSVKTNREDYQVWWKAFRDPTLNRLIETAYRQNLTLMTAGTRVMEARASLGVAIGEFYPQTQQLRASAEDLQPSQTDATSNPNNVITSRNFWRVFAGGNAAWELDVWGKFRRGVESADASYLASIAT